MIDSITFDLCHELFYYKDGWLYSKVNRGKTVHVDDKLGSVDTSTGYVKFVVNSRLQYAHRIIFFMCNGYLPEEIDHINCIRHDNHIDNLRECTRSQNVMNRSLQINNTSGVKGVYWNRKRSKWQAQLSFEGKVYPLGRFDDINEARRVVEDKREDLHKEFANHG